ncbi:MAG: hypothetical protein QM784_23655 [Polyangiaceae bacterium]
MSSQASLSPHFPTHFGSKQPLGRRLAQFFCVLFGVVGALPLLVGLVLRTERVRTWAEQQTTALLREQLGLVAAFRARVNLRPLELSVEDLVVPSSDGGAPALSIERLRVAPRFFSLLAGKLDVGDVVVDSPRVRLRISGGHIENVAYRLPPSSSGPKKKLTESPFASVSITDAAFDVTIDGQTIQTESFDLDVTAERKLAFEVFLRSSGTTLTAHRKRSYSGSDRANHPASDEDNVCEIDLRARLTDRTLLIRRLSALGRADLDPKAGTRPNCNSPEDETDPGLLALRLSDFEVDFSKASPALKGQYFVRAPAALVNRFVRFLPLEGWLGLRGDVAYDGSTKLPRLQATAHGEGLALGQYRLFKELDLHARLENDHVLVDELEERFADGQTRISGVDIAPFEPDVPFSAKRVEVKNMSFPGLMRDLGVTNKTIVAWDFGDTVVTELAGHLGLPKFEGHIVAHTRDFEVFDRAFDDPKRRHMIGVARGNVDGRILVKPTALEFRDVWVTFGASKLFTQVVSIGFSNELEIGVADTSHLDLADISPIATIPISGKAKMGAHMRGKATDPVLYGSLGVKDFVFGGFPIGDIISSKVKFWPLKVEITNTLAQKGQSQFTVPKALLDFDTRATVVVDAQAQSQNLNLRDFLAMWHFEDDPRYAEIRASAPSTRRFTMPSGGPRTRATAATSASTASCTSATSGSSENATIRQTGRLRFTGSIKMRAFWDSQSMCPT